MNGGKAPSSLLLQRWRRPYTPGPLTVAEFEQYWNDGFVIKRRLLQQTDLAPCLAAIERRVDGVARKLLAAGAISDAAQAADVFTRLTLLEAAFPEASVLVHKDGALSPEFAALWCCPSLLAVAQQLLGPDVAGHPSWNLRAKTPRQAAANVPWHQDTAYCGRDSWQTLQVTAWVPLLDVNAANGCMQLLRRGHTAGKTVRHTAAVGDTWYVAMDEEAAAAELGVDLNADVVTAEMSAGDVLLFNNLVPHRSLENTSSSIRWSLDLRWQRPDEPDGAFGIKPVIRMTQASSPGFTIPWEGWIQLDKKSGSDAPPDVIAAQAVAAAGGDEHCGAASDAELSPIICGPWLDIWPVTHHNKHTRAWAALKAQQQQQAAPACAVL